MMTYLLDAGWEPFTTWPIWRFLLEGMWISVQIALYAIALSLVTGTMMAVGRLAPNRGIRWLAGTYVEVFRATPLLLLIFFVFFGIGRLDLSGVRSLPFTHGLIDERGDLQRIPAVVIALTLYNGAVVAEIVRAGIVSISKGIIEASRALGLSYLQSMRFVALPMALRRMAPGLVSQLITLFKDTSLASLISIVELMRRGRTIYDSPVYNNTLETLLVVSLMYFIPCYALSLLAQRLERSPDLRGEHVPATIVPESTVVAP
jgi:glutamate transport system permease protein